MAIKIPQTSPDILDPADQWIPRHILEENYYYLEQAIADHIDRGEDHSHIDYPVVKKRSAGFS